VRPENKALASMSRRNFFGVFRRMSRTLLSLAIVLIMFQFMALTHGNFGKTAGIIDLIKFLFCIFLYIGLAFNLSYDDHVSAEENLTNLKCAFKMIFLTILAVSLIAVFIFLEIKFQLVSQVW
jgi:hypothetical protein